ncbi:MAG: PilZ domain-containing protein [Endomicrobium sp.]|jgi:Tfp pilus assembly protein PilZ|nr:PilZ domain-containing protein [Endomicrobium sp.]
MVEKRKLLRMPVIKQFGEEVMIQIGDEAVPGVILDLSVEGISLLTFTQVPIGSVVCLSIDIPALKTNPINGKVVWVAPKGEMFRIGIHIFSINSLDSKQINRMAIDFNDCENKIMLGVPDVCVKKCSYYKICAKPQKASIRNL